MYTDNEKSKISTNLKIVTMILLHSAIIVLQILCIRAQSLMLYLMLTFSDTLNLVQSMGECLNESEYNLDER